MSEAAFHRVANDTLEQLEAALAPLVESARGDDESDVTLAMGVLTLRLGATGTYVINKQTPNRQLWWSSPMSGPRRYAYDAATGAWLNTRDSSSLVATLHAELAQLTTIKMPELLAIRSAAAADK